MSSCGRKPTGMARALPALMLAVGTLLFVEEAFSASTLQSLVEGARAEGELDLMISSSQGEKGARELTDAFKQRFGLSIKTNADLSGLTDQKITQAIAETKGGIPPSFDLMEAPPLHINRLVVAGGAERIENWDSLLKEIVPEAYKIKDKLSPEVLSGYGFLWGTRILALLYNPKLISKEDLPKTWKEKADPRYAGAYSVPPWIDASLGGILKYDKDEWLRIIKGVGQNKRQVLTYTAAVQRMMLGELKFVDANTETYFVEKARDPNAPVELAYYEDFTPLDQQMNVVRKGARHPNAARLFALWASGSEANRIFEKYSFQSNFYFETPITQKIKAILAERKVRPVSWFDSPQTVEKLRWLETEEGVKYSAAISKAQREGM